MVGYPWETKPDMTPEQVNDMCAGVYRTFLKPKYILRQLMRIRSIRDLDYVWRGAVAVIEHLKDSGGAAGQVFGSRGMKDFEVAGMAHRRTPSPVLRRTERPKPKGFWQRTLIGNPLFLWRVVKQCPERERSVRSRRGWACCALMGSERPFAFVNRK